MNCRGNDANTAAPRTVVITGGSDGMGRGLALGRAARGDRVVAVGSSQAKGQRLLEEAAESGSLGRIEFRQADLRTTEGNQAVIDRVMTDYGAIDALVLAANRGWRQRTETNDGFESTFALYYLSRNILGRGLMPALESRSNSVIVNIAGVGNTAGRIHWDDLQLRRRYRIVTAQLQAGRANDLLGVAMAEQFGDRVPYVLYHPGFTRSGDSANELLDPVTRGAIKALAVFAARPVEKAIAPVHEIIDSPPAAPLTAVDRGKLVPLDLRTLDPLAAQRLAGVTAHMLTAGPTSGSLDTPQE